MKEKIARKLLMHDMPHVDSWQLIDERIRKDYMHRADAVLDALMEPTDEMIGAMYECHEKSAPVYFYRAAIQAAKEGK